MIEPRYLLTPEGVRFQNPDGRLDPPLDSPLSLLYDRIEGTLLKHGAEARVTAYFARSVSALAGTELVQDLAVVTISPEYLGPAVLDEVNRAIQIAGYARQMARRLSEAPEPAEGELPR